VKERNGEEGVTDHKRLEAIVGNINSAVILQDLFKKCDCKNAIDGRLLPLFHNKDGEPQFNVMVKNPEHFSRLSTTS
jgi:hypothetical protein